jgi:GABA permease
VINQTGPAAVLSYLAAGLLVVLVMRMLGEMAVANPSTGSFADYSRLALGNWAGFTTGWLYWWFWVIVLAIEAVAGAEIIQRWIDIPIWASSLVLMILLTLTNLASVKSYGEFEFWFASIKVAAIIAFIVLALAFALGLTGSDVGFSHLSGDDGFAPEGMGKVLTGVVIVIFAFVGPRSPRSRRPRPTIVVVIRSMAFVDETRDQLWWSLGSLAVGIAAAWLRTMQPWQLTTGARRTSTASTS